MTDAFRTPERLAKARAQLVFNHPFIASLAMGMESEVTYGVPTAGVDGKKMYFNPDFCNTLSDNELLFLLAHECMHPALEHIFRRGDRDMMVWNMATDYVVNQFLTDENVGVMPTCGLLDNAIYKAGDGTSEGIYNHLVQQGAGQKEEGDGAGSGGFNGSGMGGPGQPLDECMDAAVAQDKGESAAMQRTEWQLKVQQAALSARAMGGASLNVERLVKKLLKPMVNWRTVLQDFVMKCRMEDRTWARPARRFVPFGLYLPSVSGDSLPPLAIAIDVSGSVTQRELTQFRSELAKILEDLHISEIHLMYFSTRVTGCEVLTADSKMPMLVPRGGGGTAFSPVFEYIAKQDIKPEACIVLTDLCCSDFGPEPEYPVLWVSSYKTTAPFGRVVPMNQTN